MIIPQNQRGISECLRKEKTINISCLCSPSPYNTEKRMEDLQVRKILSVLLSLALMAGLYLPALADEGQDWVIFVYLCGTDP